MYAFASIEFFVAVTGLLSKPVIYDFLYQGFFHHRLGPSEGFWVVLITTLIPTFCMGATLPLLSRAYSKTLSEAIGNTTFLYCLNTLGAGLGAILTSMIFIRQVGYANTLLIAATANILCAVGALILANFKKTDPEPAKLESEATQSTGDKQSLQFWCAVYALSGFTALGLEIIWFRLLNVMLKANSMVFGSLLGLYLLGLALGTFIGAKLFAKKAPTRFQFFMLQAAIPLYAVISLVLFVNFLGVDATLREFFDFFARYNPVYFDDEKLPSKTFFMVFIVLPVCMIIPPTVLMGLSFSALQHLAQSEISLFEKRVGILQACNIFGSGLGAVFVGMFLLEIFGTSGSLYFFLAIALIFVSLSVFSGALISISSSARNKLVIVVSVLLLFFFNPCHAQSRKALVQIAWTLQGQ